MSDLFSRLADRATASTAAVRPLMPPRFDSIRVEHALERVAPVPTVIRENIVTQLAAPALPSVAVTPLATRGQPESLPHVAAKEELAPTPNVVAPKARVANVEEPARRRAAARDVVPTQVEPRPKLPERLDPAPPQAQSLRAEQPPPTAPTPNVRRARDDAAPSAAKPAAVEHAVVRTEVAPRAPAPNALVPASRLEAVPVRPREQSVVRTSAVRSSLQPAAHVARETEIHVNIGRIEIRTTSAAPAPKVVAPAAPRGPSLQEYLERSSKPL